MKSILKITLAAIFSLSAINVYAEDDAKPDAPAKEKADKPMKTELTGTFMMKNDKVKFKGEDGKMYTILKAATEDAKKHVDKKVKVSCKVKTKKGKDDKDMHIITKILSVEAAAAATE
ncbi:hypothetical protein [Oceaniferula spumae]